MKTNTLRDLLLGVALAMSAVFLPTAGRSAESLSMAVDEIAQRLIGSRVEGAPPIRIAVNVFAHPDRRTSMLSNQFMIALTGRLVELGGNNVRVIERAQLESALGELELASVPIFDAATAKDLGNFLGVEALVVGEMNALTDQVRVHARMISVETVETMVSASTWIPLTPTIQTMADTEIRLARPVISSGDGPDPRNGVWRGQGTCGDLTFGLAVAMVFNPDDSITAMQTYFPLSSRDEVESGSLEMEGSFDPSTGKVTLNPGSWFYQPPGHTALGFDGTLDPERGIFEGAYTNEACGTVALSKR